MNDHEKFIKISRLYVDQELSAGGHIALSPAHAHYLRNVLRQQAGDLVRLFDGRNGEWLCAIEELGKKTGLAKVERQIRRQTETERVHLLFAPIKKARMDFLIEKAVELGVTDLHPVITQNTEVRRINEDRVRQQIIEAAEQCERLMIPVLHDAANLRNVLGEWSADVPVMACLERAAAPPLAKVLAQMEGAQAFLVGPEGGFTGEEKQFLSGQCHPVSLGEDILRTETAALYTLAVRSQMREPGIK